MTGSAGVGDETDVAGDVPTQDEVDIDRSGKQSDEG